MRKRRVWILWIIKFWHDTSLLISQSCFYDYITPDMIHPLSPIFFVHGFPSSLNMPILGQMKWKLNRQY